MKTQTSFTVMSELRAGRGLAYVSHITHGGVGVNLQSLAYSF